MTATDLLNCPFCGSETVEDWGESTWSRPVMWMYCAECNAKGPRVTMQRNEQNEDWMGRAIAAWNNRTPDPAAQALVEAARCLMSALHTTRGTGRITQSVENTLDRIDAALAAFEEGQA